MKTSNIGRIADRRLIRGQGMTEYIIIVALIAIAAIAVVGQFGGVVKNQFAAMAAELGGASGDTPNAAAKTIADDAATVDAAATTLDAFTN